MWKFIWQKIASHYFYKWLETKEPAYMHLYSDAIHIKFREAGWKLVLKDFMKIRKKFK